MEQDGLPVKRKTKDSNNCDESSQTKEDPLFDQVATSLGTTMREKK